MCCTRVLHGILPASTWFARPKSSRECPFVTKTDGRTVDVVPHTRRASCRTATEYRAREAQCLDSDDSSTPDGCDSSRHRCEDVLVGARRRSESLHTRQGLHASRRDVCADRTDQLVARLNVVTVQPPKASVVPVRHNDRARKDVESAETRTPDRSNQKELAVMPCRQPTIDNHGLPARPESAHQRLCSASARG